MSNGRETAEGFSPEAAGQNLIDFSKLPGYSAGIPSFFQYFGVNEKTLAQIVDPAGSCRDQDLRTLTNQLEEGTYNPELVESYALDLTLLTAPKKPKSVSRNWGETVGLTVRGLAVAALLFVAARSITEPSISSAENSPNGSGKGILQEVKDSFLTSGQALRQFLNLEGGASVLETNRAPKDTFGAEMTLAELEALNIKITARDYIKDVSGNVVKQIAVVNNIVYESDFDPANGTFSEFKGVSQLPPAEITSMISSSDGKVTIVGGISDMLYRKTKMFVSYDDRKNWKEIAVPADFIGITSDMARFTDRDFFGTTIENEGVTSQFIVKVDPVSQTAAIQPASIETVVPVNMQVGSLRNIDVTALDTASKTATFVSNRYLNHGLAVSTINYDTGIGTARVITQTLMTDGTLINLEYVVGTGVYTDTAGNLRIATSNFIRNTLYDLNLDNPLDGTSTEFYYANLCDDKGIPSYIPGSLSISAIDVYFDAQGNKKIKYGGGRGDLTDGLGRAIIGTIEDGVCLDLEPYRQSGIGDMQRMKISNQLGYEVNISNLGKAFVDGNYNVYYTDRGLGSPLILPTPTPAPTYKLYLPVVFRNN